VNENNSNQEGSSTGRWVVVATSDAVDEGSAIEVIVEDQILAIFRDSGVLYALDGMCAHQGGPIAQGEVAGGCVTCPWHGWQYELKTGIQTINRQPLQRTFPVREMEGRIEVQL
jgi:nitrite reductase/ring-hydroxylating ferredoxin subunit